ncbi:hypothetical protein [Dysosmobacter sp.]|uniref:hypothetical protein n=1 Tax=Dysosmobacter sp. TaxID=2591382 RepID=UPI002A9D87F8|nr:hypothetical protein [Dysosmobacter sp.]MDY5611637.1 hypothetical protein [Dysosmobacter sp.]
MKIYSWKHFWCGLFAGALGVLKLWRSLRGDFDNGFVMGICCIVMSARCLYVALNEDAYEKDKAESAEFQNVSRSMFGKWAPVVINIGWVVAIGALLLILLNPNLAGISILLMLVGLLYEIIVNQMVKKWM